MRLTVYADYSLRLLMYLGLKDDGLATIPTVAESYRISRNHLVKVAHRLGQEGYITTVRGKNGGLRLARPAAAINIGEVVQRMEPDMALVPCLHPVDASCPIVNDCLLRTAMEQARTAFLSALANYTLSDLIAPRNPLRRLLKIAEVSSPPG